MSDNPLKKVKITDLCEAQFIEQLSESQAQTITGGFSGSTALFPRYQSDDSNSSYEGTETGNPSFSGSTTLFLSILNR